MNNVINIFIFFTPRKKVDSTVETTVRGQVRVLGTVCD